MFLLDCVVLRLFGLGRRGNPVTSLLAIDHRSVQEEFLVLSFLITSDFANCFAATADRATEKSLANNLASCSGRVLVIVVAVAAQRMFATGLVDIVVFHGVMAHYTTF